MKSNEKMLFDSMKKTQIPLLVCGIGLLYMGYGFDSQHEQLTKLAKAFGIICVILSLGNLLYSYLQSQPSVEVSASSSMRSELEDIKLELLRLKKKKGQTQEDATLSDQINALVKSSLTDEFIESRVESIYSNNAINQAKSALINSEFDKLGVRIDGEIARLRRSANLNLVIGTLTTAIAISSLGYEVFNNQIKFTDTLNLLSHYLPRLSLVLFIELFAFFFLRVYKNNLEDIKYFNNERTNVDMKFVALNVALQQAEKELIINSVNELVTTERNFKLGKDESTIDLQRSKVDIENNRTLAGIIEKLIGKV